MQWLDDEDTERLLRVQPYVGIGDHVVYGPPWRQGWTGFWDWDHHRPPLNIERVSEELRRNVLEFETGNGYHYYSLEVTDWNGKLEWYHYWTRLAEDHGIKPDYLLVKRSVLRLSVKDRVKPRFVQAYRYAPRRGSSFHLDQMRELVDPGVLHALYPRVVETWGGYKFYRSDPWSVFDVVKS